MSGSAEPQVVSTNLSFWDRASDWVNPILVKEIRQAFKSRIFGFAFVLLLGLCWVISYLGTVSVGRGLEFYSYGTIFFGWYFLVLFGAIFVVVPFTLYWNMCAERMDDTLDTLSITTLRARRIVNGKLAGALVQILFYFAAILPFIAFTSLLNGFRLGVALIFLVIVFSLSIATSTLALALSTLTKSRIFQGILGLALIAGILWVYLMSVGGILQSGGLFDPPDSWQFYWPMLILIGALWAVAMFLREIAISALTFESDNRSSGIRITLTVLFLFFWSSLPVLCFFVGGPFSARDVHQMSVAYTVSTAIALGIVSLFLVAEPVELSRRVRRQIPRNRMLKMLVAPWFPGASRGYLFVLVHVVAMIGILLLIMILIGPYSAPSSSYYGYYGGYGERHPVVFSLDYLVIYAGVACLATRLARTQFPQLRAAELRLSAFIIVLGIVLAPHIFDVLRLMLGKWDNDFHFWMILSPFFYQSWRLGIEMVSVLTFVAALVVVANIPGIARDIIDMYRPIPAGSPKSSPSAEAALMRQLEVPGQAESRRSP